MTALLGVAADHFDRLSYPAAGQRVYLVQHKEAAPVDRAHLGSGKSLGARILLCVNQLPASHRSARCLAVGLRV